MADELIVHSDGSTEMSTFTPVAFVPPFITRRQAKLALHSAGLLDAADAAIAAAGVEAQIDWADALEFRRDYPLIAGIGSSLGLTSEQIDDLFREAAKL